jgi:hypothetical protein
MYWFLILLNYQTFWNIYTCIFEQIFIGFFRKSCVECYAYIRSIKFNLWLGILIFEILRLFIFALRENESIDWYFYIFCSLVSEITNRSNGYLIQDIKLSNKYTMRMQCEFIWLTCLDQKWLSPERSDDNCLMSSF